MEALFNSTCLEILAPGTGDMAFTFDDPMYLNEQHQSQNILMGPGLMGIEGQVLNDPTMAQMGQIIQQGANQNMSMAEMVLLGAQSGLNMNSAEAQMEMYQGILQNQQPVFVQGPGQVQGMNMMAEFAGPDFYQSPIPGENNPNNPNPNPQPGQFDPNPQPGQFDPQPGQLIQPLRSRP